MKKTIVSIVLALALLSGCTATPEVVPVVSAPDTSELIVRPPAEAMTPAHNAIPLKKGDTKAGNIVTLRQNNLLCVDDRAKLTTLQKYILGLFPDKN